MILKRKTDRRWDIGTEADDSDAQNNRLETTIKQPARNVFIMVNSFLEVPLFL